MSEIWIWTELLAFDNTREDFCVQEYLDRIGSKPYGIHLLLSSVDFVMLHDPITQEKELFPDVCSRFGHERNEERERQNWTNHQLRGLIKQFQSRGIKVFFSVFILNLQNKFHQEYVSTHPEIRLGCSKYGIDNAISFLARLKDGRLFDDVFREKLLEVVQDYGFDGWVGCDGQGPGWSLTHSDCSDNFVMQFAEHIGIQRIPPEFLAPAGDCEEKMKRRIDYIWQNLRREWADFTSYRWNYMWTNITADLHKIGRQAMIYSPFAKSAFESIFYFGLDYRHLKDTGIDYLVTESVTTSCSMLYGGEERVFEHSAIIAEFKTVLPKCKLIVMSAVKDVVESFDPLRHAPARLERDIFVNTNQCLLSNNQGRRCADGHMVCLGDGLTTADWQYLDRLHKMCFDFDLAAAGDFAWLSVPAIYDALRDDHEANGTWPPYHYVTQLQRSCALDISCVCTADDITTQQPLVVPLFDLLPTDLQQKVLARKGYTVIIGNLKKMALPADASCISCPINDNYTVACAVLNGAAQPQPPVAVVNPQFNAKFDCSTWNSYVRNSCPKMVIPEEFWSHVGSLIKANLPAPLVSELSDGMHSMSLSDSAGQKRLAIFSVKDIYASTKCRFADSVQSINKLSPFPYSPLQVHEHQLTSGDCRPTVNLPPNGMIMFDLN